MTVPSTLSPLLASGCGADCAGSFPTALGFSCDGGDEAAADAGCAGVAGGISMDAVSAGVRALVSTGAVTGLSLTCADVAIAPENQLLTLGNNATAAISAMKSTPDTSGQRLWSAFRTSDTEE